MSLGKQLTDARKAKKLRQRTIAEELGVTVQAVSQWERDKTIPGDVNMMKLSKLLGVEFEGSVTFKNLAHLSSIEITAPVVTSLSSLHWGDDEKRQKLLGEEDYIEMDAWSKRRVAIDWKPEGSVFAMEVEDRSMAPDFLPGDLIIVDNGANPSPGDLVVGQKYPSAGGLFRKYRLRGEDGEGRAMVDLVPINSDFPTTSITAGIDGEITGCVMEFRRFFGKLNRP